jgi:tetratricopeptide (TPR) repeat protein/TolB-like protein
MHDTFSVPIPAFALDEKTLLTLMNRALVSTVSNSPQVSPPRLDPDRLDSWKEIATYFRREVRTVQLWEKREGLPVHRHFHKQLGSVFAFRSELKAWNEQVSQKSTQKLQGTNETANTAATQEPVQGRVTIRVEPILNQTPANQALCHAIVAKTVAVLSQLNPDKLTVESGYAAADATADYLLKWSAQDEDTGLEINAELIFPGNQTVTWSQRYRCSRHDLEALPGHLADQIVLCVWLKVVAAPPPCRTFRPGEKPAAREAYLKGRYFWQQRNEESLRKAVQCFETAIHEDRHYALPYSGLADSLTLLSFYEIVPATQAMPAARRAALKAIELGPDLAETHASLADIRFHFERDWEGAELEYRRAIQCNPGYALSYHWYANLLAAKGQHEAAQIAILRALEINPVSLITLVWAGVTSHLARRFDEAVKYYQSALELDSNFVWAHMYLAQALEQKGDYQKALCEFENTIKLARGSNCALAMKAHAHALAGDTSCARQILRGLKSSANQACVPSYDIAATHAALGESKQMGFWLTRACNERNMKLFSLMQDPRFDSLRHLSEFRQVVDHVGLPRYSNSPSALS